MFNNKNISDYKKLAQLIISLSKFDFNNIFFDTKGNNIEFSKIFPPGSYSIVGNSPILLDYKNGKYIDQSDYVIRFSEFSTENIEEFTGKKTSVWVTNNSNTSVWVTNNPKTSVTNNSNTIPNDKIPFIYLSTQYSSFQQKINDVLNLYKNSNFIIFQNDSILELIYTNFNCIPSSGLLILLLLVTKYKEIYAYGFTFGYYNRRYHYLLKDKSHNPLTNYQKESIIFSYLIKNGMLKKINHISALSKSKVKKYSLIEDTNKKLEEIFEILKDT